MKRIKDLLDRLSKREATGKIINFILPERKDPITAVETYISNNPDQDHTSNYLKICFHYFYKHWIRYQHIFGILLYTGYSGDSPNWIIPFVWVVLFIIFNRLRFATLRYGAKLQYFIMRFLYFAGITLTQAIIFTPFLYMFLPKQAQQNLIQLVMEIINSIFA